MLFKFCSQSIETQTIFEHFVMIFWGASIYSNSLDCLFLGTGCLFVGNFGYFQFQLLAIGQDKQESHLQYNALGTGAIGPSLKLCPTSNMNDGAAAVALGDSEGENREGEQLGDKAGEVTITHSISLTFNGSKPALIPSQFVVKDCKGFVEEK